MKMSELEQYRVKNKKSANQPAPNALSFDLDQYRVNQDTPTQVDQPVVGQVQQEGMPYIGQKGFPGILEDIKETASNAPREAFGALPELASGAYHGLKQFAGTDTRGRAIGNIAAGFPELLKQIYNIGPRATEYLAEKEILPESFKGSLEKYGIGETGLKRKLFGEPQPGDEFLEGLAPFLVAKRPLSSGRAKALPTLGAITAIQGGNPLAGVMLGEIFNQAGGLTKAGVGKVQEYGQVKTAKKELPFKENVVKETESQYQQAEKAYNEALSQENIAKSDLSKNIEESGGESIHILNKRVMKNTDKIKSLNEEYGKIPETKRLEEFENIYNESQSQIKQTESALNKQLGQGLTHNERIAKDVYEAQNKIEKEVSTEYKEIGERLKGIKVPVKSTPEIIKLQNDLKKAIPGISDAVLQSTMEKAAVQLGIDLKNNHIRADKYYSDWKTIRDQGYKLRKQSIEATEEGPRRQYYEASVKALNAADKMKAIMQNIFPPDVYQRLISANERFKNEIAPVRNNRTWYEIAANKKIKSKDLIEKLGGEGPGQEILRGHILANPKTSDLMVGSRLAGKPNRWENIDEATQPYLKSSSLQTQQLINDYNQARRNSSESQSQINNLSPSRAAQNKIKEQSSELIQSINKDKKILEELRAKEKSISEAQERVSKAKEGMNISEKNKKLALKDKMENEKKIKEYEEKINKTKSKLAKILIYGASASVGLKIMRTLF